MDERRKLSSDKLGEFSCRVDYDYDGGTGAWFNFTGTPDQFADALSVVFQNKVYRIVISEQDEPV